MTFLTASSVFDMDTARAIAFLRLYGKKEPTKNRRNTTIAFAALALVLASLLYFRGLQWHLVLFLGLCLVMLLAVQQLPKVMPGVQYDKFGALKDTESRYLFGEEQFIMTSSVEDYVNQYPVRYDELDNVHESDDYLFLFHKNKVLYTVAKSTVDPTQLPRLTALLQEAVEKYTRCEY